MIYFTWYQKISHKIKLFYQKFFILIFFFILSPQAMAQSNPGLGSVAKNLMSPINVLANFIDSACLLIGGAFLFASIIKYFEHRRNPLMVPISTVIFLLIGGLLLVALPLVGNWTNVGVKFLLFK